MDENGKHGCFVFVVYGSIDRDDECKFRLLDFIQSEYGLSSVNIAAAKRGFYGETWKLNVENADFFVKLVYCDEGMTYGQMVFYPYVFTSTRASRLPPPPNETASTEWPPTPLTARLALSPPMRLLRKDSFCQRSTESIISGKVSKVTSPFSCCAISSLPENIFFANIYRNIFLSPHISLRRFRS